MHDGMQYDPIQRQGQGHEPLKVENSAIFSKRLSPIMGLANDDHGFLNWGQYLCSLLGPDLSFLS